MPDFRTIADFRKDNGDAITARSWFVALCRKMKVFSHAIIAIGSSELKEVNNRNRNFTARKIKAPRKPRAPETAPEAGSSKPRTRVSQISQG